MADNSTRIVLTAEDKTAAAIASARANLSGLQAAAAGVTGALSGLGAGVSLAGLAAMVKGSIDAADAMNDLSQKVGIAVRDLAGWKLASESSGTSMEAVAKGVKGLSGYMHEHAKELRSVGVTASDANGAMMQLSDIFKALPDGMQKAALATKIFGKAGMEMLPMLNLGSAGLAEMQEKAAEYGRRMAVLAPQADRFNDLLAEMSLQSKVMGINLGIELVPSLIRFTEQLMEGKKIAGGWTSAMWEFGVLLDPTKGIPNSLNETRVQLEKLHAEMEKGKAQNLRDGGLTDLSDVERNIGLGERRKKYLEFLQRQAAMEGAAKFGDIRDARDRRVSDSGVMSVAEAQAAAEKLMKDKAANPYDAIKKKAEDFIKTLEKETAQLGLNVQQRKMIEAAMIAGTLRTEAEQKAVMGAAQAWAAKSEAIEQAAAAARENNRIFDAALDQEERERVAVEHGIKSLREYVDKLDEETFALTATSAQLREHIILREMERSGLEKTSDAYAEMEKRMRASMSANEIAKDVKKAAEESARAWEKFTSDIESSLTDALMRGFENGSSFGENFVKSLQNTLKTAVLKIAVQAVVNPIMSGIGGALGITGGGSGGGMGLPGIPGGGVYNAFATSSAGQSLGLSEAFIANAELGTAAETGVALTSSGATLGAALPWIGGALAVGSLLGAFDGEGDAMRTGRYYSPFAFSNGPGDPTQGNNADGSRYNYLNNSWFSADMQAALDDFDTQMQETELAIAAKLGLQAKDWEAINTRLLGSLGDKRYNFGMEHTDVRSSGALEQIRADRLQAISDALGMSLRDLQDTMSGAKKSAYELAQETQKLSAEQNKAKAQALLAGMGATLGAIDSVTGLRSGIMASIAGVRGGNSYDSRMSGLQALLAGETDIGRQVELAGQMKDLVLERYQTERSAIQANQSAAEEAAAAMRAGLISIGAYARSLLLSDLSPLTAAQRLAESENQFQTTLMRARQGDASAIGSLSGAAGTYLQESRGYYASSARYSDVFGSVQGALAQLGLSADSVTATGDWQAQLLAVDNAAADRLGELAGFTEEWTLNLENLLVDQTRQFEGLGLKLTDVAENTRGLDQRLAVLIDTALGARFDKLATAVEKSAATTARAVVNAVQVTVRS